MPSVNKGTPIFINGTPSVNKGTPSVNKGTPIFINGLAFFVEARTGMLETGKNGWWKHEPGLQAPLEICGRTNQLIGTKKTCKSKTMLNILLFFEDWIVLTTRQNG